MPSYRKYIEAELDELAKLYKSKNDNLGFGNVVDKKKTISDPLIATMALMDLLSVEEVSNSIIFNRELFYFYYNLLEDAKRFLEERKVQWKKESEVVSAVPAAAVLASSSAQVQPAVEKPAPAAVKETLIPKEVEVEKKKEFKAAKDHKKPVVGQDIKSAKEVVEPSAAENDNRGAADRLKKNKFKNALIELFYTDPKKAKIEETVLQAVLKRAGGECGGNPKAVRRQLSFKGKIGFIPKKDSISEKTHYHTTNTRYVSVGVIKHYRDFFHRIGIAPYQLWPKEFEAREYRPTKTTRVFAKK